MNQRAFVLFQDFRRGIRALSASPGFAAAAVLVLSLGIGANTAIFSVVKAVLLDKLPIREPGRLFSILNHNEKRDFDDSNQPYAEVRVWQRSLRSFGAIAASKQSTAILTGEEEPYRVVVSRVSWNFLPTLGVQPRIGRNFDPEEDRPNSSRVAVLSDELFNQWLGGVWKDGSEIRLDGQPHRVVGILPPGFRFVGQRADVLLPLSLPETGGPGSAVRAFGRLGPGVSREQAQAELDGVTAARVSANPNYMGWRLRLGEPRDWVPPDVRIGLWVLLGAVGLVLMVACANVAGLLLSRSLARRREMAVRAALGASRKRLVWQLLAESLPLGFVGGALGLLLALWSIQLLPQIDASRIPRVTEVSIDFPVLAFTMGISILTCVLFGLAPAVTLSNTDMREALQEGGRTAGTGSRSSRLRSVLVTAEVGLALVLAAGAGLMIRTFYNLVAVEPGFNPDRMLTASLEPNRAQFKSRRELIIYYDRVVERVRALPGVKTVGLTSSLPLGGNYFRGGFIFEGQPQVPLSELPVVNQRTADGDYFRSLQIPLLRGRIFGPQDQEGSPPVVIINDTTARRFFPGQDPIGKHVGFPNHMMTVVGVIGDIRHTDVSESPDTDVILPFSQAPMLAMTLVLRLDASARADSGAFAPLLRQALAEIDRNVPVSAIRTMEEVMTERLGARRLNTVLLTLFAVLALLLAALGIYGTLSHSVSRRSHEIGVRIALGARPGDVVLEVVRQVMILVAGGLAAGVCGTLALTRLMRGLLFGVNEADPWVMSGAVLLLAVVAAAASWVPARRAARVDPLVALRWE
jgi:putative ABC transport system permease protein